MVDIAATRRIAGGLENVSDRSGEDRLAFYVGGQFFAWSYLARVGPKGPRVPHLDVLAIRCPIERKEMLIEAAPDRFFDDDHYRGYEAVLVRLAAIDEDELRGLLEDARRMMAAKPKSRRRRSA